MAIPKWLIGLVALGAVGYIALNVLGLALMSVPFLLVVGGLIVLLSRVPMLNWLKLKPKFATYLGVAFLIGAFVMGGFNAITPPSLSAASFFGAASLAVPASVGAAPASSTDITACQAEAAKVNPAIVGKSTTVTTQVRDVESATPDTIQGANLWVFVNGQFRNTITALGGTITNVKVGEVVNIYGGNSTMYIDPAQQCITGEQETIAVTGHLVAATTSFTEVNYDNTNAATLTAGTAAEEDSSIAIGSAGNDNFYTRFRLTAANRAFRFGGYLVMSSDGNQTGATEYFKLSDETGLTKTSVPTWAKGQVAANTTGTYVAGNNVSGGYTYLYKANIPSLITSYKEVRPNWVYKAASGQNPIDYALDGAEGSANVLLAVAIVDADWSHLSGQNTLDVHDHTASEGTVGLGEAPTIFFPIGQDISTLITVT